MVVKNSRTRSQPVGESAKQWATYVKAAGLGAFAFGAARSSDAAVVHGGGTYNEAAPAFNIVINPVSYAYANRFNIDGDGLRDFRMGAGNYGTAFGHFDAGDGDLGMILTSGSPAAYAEAFAGGALIDGSAATAGIFYGARVLSNTSFAPNVSHFMGFKTSLGYFGWMELTLSPSGTFGGGVGPGAGIEDLRLTIHDWAYENTGAGIRAGQIPEPSSLALLAAGSIGLLARRRKNADQSVG